MFPSYDSLSRSLQEALTSLEIPPGLFTLGGLRAGGATHHYLVCQNVPVLQRRGRWQSSRSLDHYIQEAAVVLSTLNIPEHVSAALSQAPLLCQRALLAFIRDPTHSIVNSGGSKRHAVPRST